MKKLMCSSSCPSNEQLKLMVDYMENHPLFDRKKIPKLGECGVDKYRCMWATLGDLLNAIGPAQRTPEQCEKVSNIHGLTSMYHPSAPN